MKQRAQTFFASARCLLLIPSVLLFHGCVLPDVSAASDSGDRDASASDGNVSRSASAKGAQTGALPPDKSSGKPSDSSSSSLDAGTTLAPSANCDGALCGSACTKLDSDPENRGACGNKCGDASCMSAVCQPEYVDITGMAHQVLTDGTAAYWQSRGSVLTLRHDVPRGGATPQELWHFADPKKDQTCGLALNESSVFLAQGPNGGDTDSGLVVAIAKASGSVTTLFSTAHNPCVIAADSGFIYWTEFYDQRGSVIRKLELKAGATGTPVNLNEPLLSLYSIATDDQNIYFVDGSRLTRMSKKDGSRTKLISVEPTPSGIVIDAGYVYWVDEWSGSIRRAKTDGSGGEMLAEHIGTTNSAFALANDRFFVSTEQGVTAVARTGAGAAPISFSTEQASAFAVGDKWLFGANGSLWRMELSPDK